MALQYWAQSSQARVFTLQDLLLLDVTHRPMRENVGDVITKLTEPNTTILTKKAQILRPMRTTSQRTHPVFQGRATMTKGTNLLGSRGLRLIAWRRRPGGSVMKRVQQDQD